MEGSGSAQDGPAATFSPCLLDNWQEERSAASLDRSPCTPGPTQEEPDHRHGHRGILSIQLLADMASSTTHQDSYGRPREDSRRHTGLREEQLRRELYHKFSQEILEELSSPTKETTIRESTTRRDYEVQGFIPQLPAPRTKHDYATEQAVTFWSENVRTITGVSDIRSRDSPFKKSSAFTTSISHYLDQPLPHGMENYPNMRIMFCNVRGVWSQCGHMS
ncbi:sperm-associated antigen 8-like isoform X2 [Hyla sarda]|nr:sperm-associated antigen 8-like isoform X2 [Hyla sarda]